MDLPYEVEAPTTSECPVSIITQRSYDLIQIVQGIKAAKEEAGVRLSAEAMPGYLYDAIRLVRREYVACENARIEAEERIG